MRKEKKTFEIQEEVAIIQENRKIILEKGDKIQVFKEEYDLRPMKVDLNVYLIFGPGGSDYLIYSDRVGMSKEGIAEAERFHMNLRRKFGYKVVIFGKADTSKMNMSNYPPYTVGYYVYVPKDVY